MTIFRYFPQNFLHFPKKSSTTENLLMTSFLVIDLLGLAFPKKSSTTENFSMTSFLVIDLIRPSSVAFLNSGPKPVANIDRMVKNPKFPKFQKVYTTLIILSSSKGGQTPLPTSMGPLPDSPLIRRIQWIRN